MRRILLAAACLVATAMPALAQTLRVSLRQDLDIPGSDADHQLRRAHRARRAMRQAVRHRREAEHRAAARDRGYEWADDRTLVIHLRSGVKFQDGETMDADAVKYSLERHLTLPGSFRKSEINSIDHVEVVDPSTVRIVLKNPSGAFLAQLTDRSGMVYPPKATEAAGKNFALHPVCSGPFSFVERVAQDHVTLQRFPALLGCEGHPLRQGCVSGPAGQFGAACQFAGRHDRYHGIPGADRRRRR